MIEFPTIDFTTAFSPAGEPTLRASPATMPVPLATVMVVSPASAAFASVVVTVVAGTALIGMTVQ